MGQEHVPLSAGALLHPAEPWPKHRTDSEGHQIHPALDDTGLVPADQGWGRRGAQEPLTQPIRVPGLLGGAPSEGSSRCLRRPCPQHDPCPGSHPCGFPSWASKLLEVSDVTRPSCSESPELQQKGTVAPPRTPACSSPAYGPAQQASTLPGPRATQLGETCRGRCLTQEGPGEAQGREAGQHQHAAGAQQHEAGLVGRGGVQAVHPGLVPHGLSEPVGRGEEIRGHCCEDEAATPSHPIPQVAPRVASPRVSDSVLLGQAGAAPAGGVWGPS